MQTSLCDSVAFQFRAKNGATDMVHALQGTSRQQLILVTTFWRGGGGGGWGGGVGGP